MWRVWLASAALALCAAPADAREVRVPLRLDYPFLRELLIRRAFSDPEETARVYTDGVDCTHVVLSQPDLRGGDDGRLRVRADVDAKLGTLFVGICLFPVEWRGKIESTLEPWLEPGQPVVRFRALDSRLLEPDGSESPATAAVWEWLKGHVHPRLERLAVDLAAPMADLRAVLPLFLAPASAERARQIVDTLSLERVAVAPDEVVLELRFDAPPAPPPEPRGPEPELSPEELARFDESLSAWDGFITTVVKRAGNASEDAALREQLFEVLMDAREELVASLGEPAQAGPDPVRPLFLASWQRLAGVLRELGPRLGDEDALRYLGFVAAADALAAVDALGPDLGLEMSSDGLRHLARLLAPEDPADPLEAPDTVDPELRRALDFGDPIPPPADLEPEPPPAPEPEPAPAPPTSALDWLFAALRALVAPTAHAATAPPELTREELARLRGWVPRRSELNEYLPLVDRLLRAAARDALAKKAPALELARIYRDMQLATAWQETCWRHYVRSKGAVITIRSSAGAVGIMQVNSRVWRGFYDPRFLLADVSYNGRAGSEILLRYFLELAYAKGEHKRQGGHDNLVRAAYAAYNGGPRHLTRYRNPKTAKSLRALDAGFFKKYEAVRAGRVMEVRRCFG